ncbi:hypothetical protein PsYK624_103670 [Phanerochaete sordida]|uniref:Fungal-type protein kinase domain-containing protein n=1 Tax=Phanerochaete sordida TaxID=48140 RepID=A0A9P3GH48_9APHY|nr:hypothetical protein PsYK624_103670 [Phanerochaete sordida]
MSEITTDDVVLQDVPSMPPRRIVSPVAYPLWGARTSKELVQALFDALTALKGIEDAGFLHRDINIGNVMITKDGRGVLTDCDHGRSITPWPSGEDQGFTGPPFRLATWQFMSTRILQDPDVQHTLQDDLESAFWVLLWIALKWFPRRGHWISFKVFNETDVIETRTKPSLPMVVGGDAKMFFLLEDRTNHLGFTSPPLNDLLKQLASVLQGPLRHDADHTSDEYRNALANCSLDSVLRMFRDALDPEDWPSTPDRLAEPVYYHPGRGEYEYWGEHRPGRRLLW